MHLTTALNVCVLIALVIVSRSFCFGYQTGKGKFESFNGNRYTEAKSSEDTSTRLFFNRNRNTPPAHDTPASSCSCSKSGLFYLFIFIFFFFRKFSFSYPKNSKIQSIALTVQALFMQIDPTFSFTTCTTTVDTIEKYHSTWP